MHRVAWSGQMRKNKVNAEERSKKIIQGKTNAIVSNGKIEDG
jgi:hypothetical protein